MNWVNGSFIEAAFNFGKILKKEHKKTKFYLVFLCSFIDYMNFIHRIDARNKI